jgi:hypothetical protein
MSVTTTYKCDRCGAEAIDDRDFLNEVGITLPERYSSYQTRKQVKSTWWCRPCLVTCALESPRHGEAGPVAPVTLEDVIRDIMREEIQAAAKLGGE